MDPRHRVGRIARGELRCLIVRRWTEVGCHLRTVWRGNLSDLRWDRYGACNSRRRNSPKEQLAARTHRAAAAAVDPKLGRLAVLARGLSVEHGSHAGSDRKSTRLNSSHITISY